MQCQVLDHEVKWYLSCYEDLVWYCCNGIANILGLRKLCSWFPMTFDNKQLQCNFWSIQSTSSNGQMTCSIMIWQQRDIIWCACFLEIIQASGHRLHHGPTCIEGFKQECDLEYRCHFHRGDWDSFSVVQGEFVHWSSSMCLWRLPTYAILCI